MKFPLFSTLGLLLFAAAFQPIEAVAGHHKEQMHSCSSHSHHHSSNNCIAYASAFSEDSQNIPPSDVFPVYFPTNLVTPVGVIHPLFGDDTEFKVREAGVYRISWDMTISQLSPAPIVTISLFNITTDTPFPSTVSSFLTSSVSDYSVSQNTILFLPADTIVQLQVGNASDTFPIMINLPSFEINRIA